MDGVGYEDILDEIYGNVVDETGRKPKFSPGRDNMVIASMKHQQDAAYVTQVTWSDTLHKLATL